MKNKITQLVLSPRCARHYNNGEAATAGEASVAVNVREQEQSLVVTGVPVQCGTIAASHRLLLVDEGHYYTCNDGNIYCDGALVTHTSHDVIAMHRVGSTLVVVTSRELIHLNYADGHCTVISKDDAIPSINLVAADEFTSQYPLDAYSFASPYSTWPAQLTAADIASLTTHYRNAWKALTTTITSQGAYYTPLMACYGVRMWDDNYLWISNAVTLGMNTIGNAQAVTAAVVASSSAYKGIDAATMSMTGYRVGIKVTGGVGEMWHSLVKCIDVFVTSQPQIADTSALYYRCLTTQGGVRTPQLQYGWQALPSSRVQAMLEASGWTMIASTTDVASLSLGRFVAPNVSHVTATATDVILVPATGGTHLSREQHADVQRGSSTIRPVASLVRNGRLYLASADGLLSCSAHGNAMVTTQVARVSGARIMALAPVSRPLYSGGFGRYAVYMFTSEGIYAVAQSALGVLGEARLVSRSVIAQPCVPVDGNCDVYYVDRHNWLCRLRGSEVKQLVPYVMNPSGLAWDDAHGEVYVIDGERVLAVTPRGAYSRRTIDAVALYDDVTHALAITAQGQVLDLTLEVPAVQQVEYVSHPVVVRAVPTCVSWCVIGTGATLSLSLYGEHGMSCHGFLVGRLRVTGDVNAPLGMPVVSAPCRTLRIEVKGTALTGTVINYTNVNTNVPPAITP